jgi:glucokinase
MSTVVGIDLGGTKVAAAVLRARGTGLSDPCVHPTELSGTEELIDELVEIIDEARGGAPIDAVGIGVPSIVEFATGRVVDSVNIPLADVALREVLGDRVGVPVFVDNDANVAALAEAHDEQLNLVSEHLVMLTTGTGVGGGIVIGGRIFRGATGGAGELGHTLIALDLGSGPFGEIPAAGEHFPQPGSLESLAAGHALDKLAHAAVAQYPDSELARKAANGVQLTGPDVIDAYSDGDGVAAALVRRWVDAVGIGIANVVNTFDPQEVVIGGGAAAAGELLLGPACEIAEGYIVRGLRGHARVRFARFGVTAGVIGAALLADQELRNGAAK